MSWTDERIERLKQLWTNGMTASQIADELGGVSRNAVIGKAHRLGLQSRPSPVKPNEPAPSERSTPAATAAGATGAAASKAPAAGAEPAPAAAKAAPEEAAAAQPDDPSAIPAQPAQPPQPQIRSIGPGGFLRQGPGDQQSPIPPAPPRRLVPAKPSAEVADKTSLLDLNERICKWPIGHPGEPDFHFCGKQANPGFPYCVEHCGVALAAGAGAGAASSSSARSNGGSPGTSRAVVESTSTGAAAVFFAAGSAAGAGEAPGSSFGFTGDGRDWRPRRCALPITALRDTAPSSSAIWLAVMPRLHISFRRSMRSSVHDIQTVSRD